jgi:orotate phosphoribosyltransferase
MKISSNEISHLLLKKEAVQINLEKLFKWSSGIMSPIYCDNRKLLSFPEERKIIVQAFIEKILGLNIKFNCIAGVATGGIAWGALVADKLDLPFVYVRSEPKKHGLSNQIEGNLPENPQVIVIEDLVSTGKSSLNACIALIEKNASIQFLISIFQYGFHEAYQNFEKHNIRFTSLTDFTSLIEIGNFDIEQKNWLLQWITNPH